MHADTEKIARDMYDAYCSAVGGKAWNGQPLPQSSEFFADPHKQPQADGWRAAARVAKEALTKTTARTNEPDSRNEKKTSDFQEGIDRFREAEKDNWKDIEDPAKWQRWIREGCPLRNEEEDFSEFFEEEE